MGRRRGDSEERRAAILAAAEAVFREGGYHGASIREIARRAEVSPALLYWFFPNKAALFAAVLQARLDAMDVLRFPAAVLDLAPEVFLPRIAHAYTRAVTQDEQVGIVRMILRDSDREPELIAALAQVIMGRVLVPLRGYLRRQMELGRMRSADPDFAAQAFMGMFVSLLVRREILQEPESRAWDVDAYVEVALQSFLQGALLRPGEAPQPLPPAREVPPVEDAAPRAARRVQIEEA